MRLFIFLFVLFTLSSASLNAQNTISKQIDSLEQEFAELDSMHKNLDAEAKELGALLKDQEAEIRETEMDMKKESQSNNLSTWLIGAVLLIVIIGVAVFMRRKREES